MKKLAAFSFDFKGDIGDIDSINKIHKEWLESKGKLGNKNGNEYEYEFLFDNSQQKGSTQTKITEGKSGYKKLHILYEPKESHELTTYFEFAVDLQKEKTLIYLEIRRANTDFRTDSSYVIKKPVLIDKLLDFFKNRIVDIPTDGRNLKGQEGLKIYLEQFLSKDRRFPLVVISENERYADVASNLLKWLAKDLAGTAHVVKIDDYISRKISETSSNKWSCFDGGIRIFWPDINPDDNPFEHPLFNFDSMLNKSPKAKHIEEGFRESIRKKLIQELSPMAVHRPKFFQIIEQENQEKIFQERIQSIRGSKENSEVYEDLIQELESQVKELLSNLTDKDNTIATLQHDLSSLKKSIIAEEAKKNEEEISTINDAINAAQQKFKENIIFTEQYKKTTQNLDTYAGPPEKLYHYFGSLNELAKELKSPTESSLGSTIIKWLNDRNIKCSGESETVKSDTKKINDRTFKVAGKTYVMEKHLKLGDAYDAAHCVRVYFEWDDTLEKIIIGYIGRHFD